MNRKIICLLGALLLVLCAVLAACDGLFRPRETDGVGETVKAPDGNNPGWYKWPSELLPDGFPVLCPEVPEVGNDSDGRLVIAARDPSWQEMKAFINSLIADGWGSFAAGRVAIVRESEKKSGKTELTDEQLLLSVLSFAEEFDSYTDENLDVVIYSGQKNGKSVLCVLYTKEREAENRFVMWVSDVSGAQTKHFSVPGCTVSIENGWTAEQIGRQIYVSYDYDPTGTCMWSLSSATGGDPDKLMEEYFSSLSEAADIKEKKSEGMKIPGAYGIRVSSFTASFEGEDMWVLYAVWQTAGGRVWQLTASANSYDVPTVRSVISGMLAGIRFDQNY